jgi:hypothetical protein
MLSEVNNIFMPDIRRGAEAKEIKWFVGSTQDLPLSY